MTLIHSWDLFDTLIGRKCGTPEKLFEEMGRMLGDRNFPDKRRKAERVLQDEKAGYNLADIYQVYETKFGVYTPDKWNLADLEFELELKNVYPIKRNVQNLKNEDIIISDMYLSDLQLRSLMLFAGINFMGEIFVSNYGKFSGEIWPKVKSRILSHCGDNHVMDMIIPARHGIRTRPAKTELNPSEKLYMHHSEELAWWIHQGRLEHIVNEIPVEKLNFLQIRLNIPLLFASCHLLMEYVLQRDIKKVLFMSRDGQMFQQLWAKLFPEIPSEYIYISRECLRGSSESYFEYLNERYTEDTCLVDMAASCGSLKSALPRLKNQHPKIWTLLFLPGFGVDVKGIEVVYATTNMRTRINNTWLEMLNYADHWHIADVVDGDPVFDQQDEYLMHYVKDYHQCFENMLPFAPRCKLKDPLKLIQQILPLINAEGTYLRNMFPGHLAFESKRKKNFERINS